jgi:hypothetical protein
MEGRGPRCAREPFTGAVVRPEPRGSVLHEVLHHIILRDFLAKRKKRLTC